MKPAFCRENYVKGKESDTLDGILGGKNFTREQLVANDRDEAKDQTRRRHVLSECNATT